MIITAPDDKQIAKVKMTFILSAKEKVDKRIIKCYIAVKNNKLSYKQKHEWIVKNDDE